VYFLSAIVDDEEFDWITLFFVRVCGYGGILTFVSMCLECVPTFAICESVKAFPQLLT
jgi:hypothetical protein